LWLLTFEIRISNIASVQGDSRKFETNSKYELSNDRNSVIDSVEKDGNVLFDNRAIKFYKHKTYE